MLRDTFFPHPRDPYLYYADRPLVKVGRATTVDPFSPSPPKEPGTSWLNFCARNESLAEAKQGRGDLVSRLTATVSLLCENDGKRGEEKEHLIRARVSPASHFESGSRWRVITASPSLFPGLNYGAPWLVGTGTYVRTYVSSSHPPNYVKRTDEAVASPC